MPLIINSGIRIFDVLQIVLTGPKSIREIYEKLRKRGISADKVTANKYLRTLRLSGFNIDSKTGKSYQIIETPFPFPSLELNNTIFDKLVSLLNLLFTGYRSSQKDLLINKLGYIQGRKLEYDKSKTTGAFPVLEDIGEEFDGTPRRAFVSYGNKSNFVTVREVKHRKNGTFLVCTDDKTEKRRVFNVEFINKIKFYEPVKTANPTVFKLNGRLRNAYILRKGEKARYTKDEVFVTNINEDKESLFERLVKYGKYCEVVFPNTDRKAFLEKVKKLIKYYKSI